MAKIIRLSKSVIGEEEKTAVIKVLEKEFLGMGEEVDIFEKKLSEVFKRSTVVSPREHLQFNYHLKHVI